MTDRRQVTERAAHFVNSRSGGVLLAASAAAASAAAVAAATWREIEHREVLLADLPAAHIRVERLSDLRADVPVLSAIEAGLRGEWGDFGLLGFDSVRQMAKEAGQTIFVANLVEDGKKTPIGALQTILVDCHGEPERLRETYSSFADLTQKKTWRLSRRKGGDTAVLLQITVFAKDGRGGGVGSLLRDAVLHMLPGDVRFAITTTPADAEAVDAHDPATFNPAMRFHAKGGATPTIVLRDFKAPRAGEVPSVHAKDVMVMRYSRDEDGHWTVPEPDMRARRMGPMQLQVTYGVRKLQRLGRRGEKAVRKITNGRRTRVRAAHAKRWIIGKADHLAERAEDIAKKSRSLVTRDHHEAEEPGISPA